MKTAINKVMWVGRATVFSIGLAVTLALLLGVTTTALAAVPGDPFKLGKLNTINKITQLVGSNPNNALLRIDNNSTGTNATALELQVEAGEPPMRVNSTTEVQGLNVDQVDSKSAGDFLGGDETAANSSNRDGKDSTAFFSGRTYIVEDRRLGPGGGGVTGRFAACDPGDSALGGGGASSEDSDLLDSAPSSNRAWFVNFQDNDFPSEIRAVALCADFPPLR